jgi:PAS domain S-box-containing protein
VSATADPVPGTALLRPAAVATEIELFSVAGHDGTLRKVNHAFARLLGLTPDELDGRSMLELVHPDDLSEVVAALSSLEAGAPEVLVENRFLVRHASAVHLEWVARPFGDTGLWWAAGRDTTRFHRLLAERTDLRARLDLALGQATAGMWEMDPSTGVLSWEPQALQVLGLADGQGHGPADAEALAARVHVADALASCSASGSWPPPAASSCRCASGTRGPCGTCRCEARCSSGTVGGGRCGPSGWWSTSPPRRRWKNSCCAWS